MILLLGGQGYVGQAICRSLTSAELSFRVVSRKSVDYSQRNELVKLLNESGASFLINAAGYTGKPNVDACEIHRTECLAGNAVLPGVIRAACEDTGTPWGHVSSGCIFTGAKPDGSGFREEDAPNFPFGRTTAASTPAARRWVKKSSRELRTASFGVSEFPSTTSTGLATTSAR